MTQAQVRPISPAQMRLIEEIIKEREVPEEYILRISRRFDRMTVKDAHDVIEWLKSLPKKQVAPPPTHMVNLPSAGMAPPPPQTVTEGVYFMPESDGTPHYFAVRRHRKSRYRSTPGLYVMEIVKSGETWRVGYHYLDMLARGEGRKLSLAEAVTYSQAMAHCAICGKKLHVQESIEQGIGPVCAAKQSAAGVRWV